MCLSSTQPGIETLCRYAEAAWSETFPKLRRDAQNRCDPDGPLSERVMRDAFENHVAGLLRRAAEDVRTLLESSLRATSADDFLGGGNAMQKKKKKKKRKGDKDDDDDAGTPEGTPDGGGNIQPTHSPPQS